MVMRSPITQPGGKYYSVKRILPQFPHHSAYKTYCEVFGGTGVLMLNKPPYNHLEVFNDFNKLLINFWRMMRNYPQEMQKQLDTTPYSREWYRDWKASLFDGTQMSDLERAIRWFYVLRSTVGCDVRERTNNWGYVVDSNNHSSVSKFRSASQAFAEISRRFYHVQIECQDFERLVLAYQRPSTFFYVDPPYIDAEYIYEQSPFTEADHRRLAVLLNNTPAMVALSYYPHSLVDELYPADKWRRVTWGVYKSVEKTSEKRQTATEMLLTNYAPAARDLWAEEAAV